MEMDSETIALNITSVIYMAANVAIDIPAVVTIIVGLSVVILNLVKVLESLAKRRESRRRHDLMHKHDLKEGQETP